MTYRERQLRVQLYESLERLAKRFRSNEDLWPVRVPRDPLSLDAIIARTTGESGGRLDAAALRSRSLLLLAWDDGSAWELWVLVLPSGLKLFCDSGGDETRILASGGRHANEEADRLFLQLLSDSRGHEFGIEMSGGPPSRVRSSIADRPFLVDFFTSLFEGTEDEAAVRRHVRERGERRPREEEVLGSDFRVDVEAWLGHVMR